MVHNFDEWTRLREIVVGTGENTSINGMDLSFRLFHSRLPIGSSAPGKQDNDGKPVINQQREDELCEDIEGFIAVPIIAVSNAPILFHMSILIVDDDNDIRTVLSFRLRAEGFDVDAVDSARVAYARLDSVDDVDLNLKKWL